MRLRVQRPGGGGLSVGRAIVRTIGLAIAIIPLFAGFVPALFDERRRALPDYLAGTIVLHDHVAERNDSPQADDDRTHDLTGRFRQ
jgi:uncharacterized RDD family membrane protein YckC